MSRLLDRTVTEQGEVFAYAYTRWSFQLLGLGDVSTRTELYFTAKQYPYNDADSQAILQLEETLGLLVINKTPVAVADRVKGTLTVDNVANGDITITVEADMTGLSQITGNWDVKMITAVGVTLMGKIGSLSVLTPLTRAIV